MSVSKTAVGLALLTILISGCGQAEPTSVSLEERLETSVSSPPTTGSTSSVAEIERVPSDDLDDGVSSTNQPLGGGSHWAGVRVDRLAQVSEVAVQGTIENVRPARLNTPTGAWEPAESTSATELHDAFADLSPLTDIDIRVTRVLGSRGDAPTVVEGELLTLTVLGGRVDVTFSPEQVEAIGLSPDTDPDTEGPFFDTPPETLPLPATGLQLSLQMAFNVSVTEGDTVVAFLSRNAVEDAYGGGHQDVWISVSPQGSGVLVRQADSNMFVARPGLAPVAHSALVDEAGKLVLLSGPAERPSGSDLIGGGY